VGVGRIASGGCWRGDAAVRQARSHRAVNSVTAPRPTFAQPYGGSSISHLLAVARVVVITAAQQRRTMRGSTQLLGRIASGGRWRGDAVMRRARSDRVVNSVNGSATRVCSAVGRHSILHQRAISRVVITGVRGSVRSGRGCVTNGRAPGARSNRASVRR